MRVMARCDVPDADTGIGIGCIGAGMMSTSSMARLIVHARCEGSSCRLASFIAACSRETMAAWLPPDADMAASAAFL